ncbi:hypothetical protein [Pseudomonas mosselii]|uniref:Uncharacterized protein n=1 Tax=Pseudomonas mosselii TaxID=78327 RepID=A0A7W2Q0Y9_9PSED|nr:hypothetical protein [Pseudomonas mosselii]MBA6068076.1 hypothetical protein [Pseudomonas mosselii]
MTLNPTGPDSLEVIVELRRRLCAMVIDLRQAGTLAQRQAVVAQAIGCIGVSQRHGLLSESMAYRLVVELESLAEQASPGSTMLAP